MKLKPLFSVLILSVVVAPFTIPYALMRYEQFKIKKTIKLKLLTGIDRNELFYLKFSKQEIETVVVWEHSTEFEFKNEMYDVVYTECSADSIFYWCWKDHEEMQLNIKLKNYTAIALAENTENEKNRKKITDFFKKFYFLQEYHWTALTDCINIGYMNFVSVTLMGCNFSCFLPPKCCFLA